MRSSSSRNALWLSSLLSSFCISCTRWLAMLALVLGVTNSIPSIAQTNGSAILQANINTIAGDGSKSYGGDGGPAVSAQLNAPFSTVVDPAGNVYIADMLNNRIRKVTKDGTISTYAGTGAQGYSGDGGPAASATFFGPHGIALDNSGNLYIADTGNQCVRMVSAGGTISTVAGSGTAGYSGDNGPATSAQLNNPSGVAVDRVSGALYIADSANHVIRKVSGGTITTVAGTGTASYTGDGLLATGATLNAPSGVALDDSGNLYIADTGNNVIRQVSYANCGSSCGTITTVAGNGTAGYTGDAGAATSAQLSSPSAIVLTPQGDIYIADSGNNCIREVTGGGNIFTVAGTSTAGYTGDGGMAVNAQLSGPDGVTLDLQGNLYIADSSNNTVRKVATSNSIALPSTNVGAVASVSLSFQFVTGTQVGSVVVVTDGGNAMDFQQGLGTSCVAATYVAGSVCTVNVNFAPGAPGLRRGAVVLYGTSSTIEPLATVYLSAIANAPAIGFGPGMISTVAGGGTDPSPTSPFSTLGTPQNVALDGSGNLYITASGANTLYKVTPGPGGSKSSVTVIPPGTVGCAGQTDTVGDGCLASNASLSNPNGVAVNHAGTIFVADTGDHRVRSIFANGYITSVTGDGTPGYSGDGGPAANAQVNAPRGLAVAPHGSILIADTGNHVIREVTAAGYIFTVAGNGSAGYTGDNGPAYLAQLSSPSAVAVDGQHNVYIADSGNRCIRKVSNGTITTVLSNVTVYNLAVDDAGNLYYSNNDSTVDVITPGGVVTIAGTPNSFGFSGDGAAANNAQLNVPAGIVADSNANLYVVDQNNDRVRKVDVSDPPTFAFGSVNVGFASPAQDIAVVNYGNLPLSVSSIVASAQFTVTDANTTCLLNGQTLNPAAYCMLGLEFAPTVSGSVQGGVTLTDNSLNLVNALQNIAASGTAVVIPSLPLPTFSLPQGGYSGPISVTLADATAGATICYNLSTDGTVPASPTTDGAGSCTSGTLYSGAIAVSSATTTIAAVATKSGYLDSPVALATYTISNQTFGPCGTPVGSTSVAIPITVKFTSGGTLGSINVLTQGAPNLDFQQVTGGTCLPGTTYAAGATCTVDVTFTPAYPGQRMGAVVLQDASGNVLATSYFSGIGTGASLKYPFLPPQNLYSNSLAPYGLATDATGNLYITDLYGEVLERSQSGAETVLMGGLGMPKAVAVDGAGNLFISEYGGVLKLAPNSSTPSVFATGFQSPAALAVDAAGYVYVADDGAGGVVKISPDGSSQTRIANGYGYSGLAVDGGGNIFITDGSTTVYQLTPNGTLSTVATNLPQPIGIAIDAAGSLYLTDTSGEVLKVLPNGTWTVLAGPIYSMFGISGGAGIALDEQGNLYMGATSAFFESGQLVELPRPAAGPTLNFATTAVGQTSPTQTVTVENDGNVPLNFTSIQADSNSTIAPSQTTCSVSTPLGVGASCNIGIQFQPTQTGSSITGSVTVTYTWVHATDPTLTIAYVGSAQKGAQTITFNNPGPQIYGTPLVLSASASSGLAVTFAAQGPCSLGIDGVTLGFTGVGTCTVTASQPGNTNYLAASTVQQSFPVQPGQATVTLSNLVQPYTGSPLSPTVTTTPSGLTYTLKGAPQTNPGSYAVSATITDPNYVGGANGTFVVAVVSVTPSSLSFATTAIPGHSAPQSITVSNQTGAPLTGISVSAPANFALSYSNCGSSLAIGASCTLQVQLQPSTIGTFSNVPLTISDSFGTQTVLLSGTSTGSLAFSATSLSFATTTVGNHSAPQSITVTNHTGQPVTGITVSVPANFALSYSNCGGISLAAGASCYLQVQLQPTIVGTFSNAPMNIGYTYSTQSGSQNGTQTVLLSGASTGSVALSVSSLSFGTVSIPNHSAPQSIKVTNYTGQPVTGITVTMPANFALSYSNCGGISLAAGASCYLQVQLQPTAVGTFSSQMNIAYSYATASGTQNESQNVALSGTGTGWIRVSTSSGVVSSLTFPLTNVGSKSNQALTLLNYTGASLTFSSIATDNPAFVITYSNCQRAPVAEGSYCSVQVTFAPTASSATPVTGNLILTDSFTGATTPSPQVLPLSGTTN